MEFKPLTVSKIALSTCLSSLSKNLIVFKEEATAILKDSYSNDLENALKESIIMEKGYKDGKRNGYNNANEMMSSILND